MSLAAKGKARAPVAPPAELGPFIDAMAEIIAKQALATLRQPQQNQQRRAATPSPKKAKK
jgi:hypothetical protein